MIYSELPLIHHNLLLILMGINVCVCKINQMFMSTLWVLGYCGGLKAWQIKWCRLTRVHCNCTNNHTILHAETFTSIYTFVLHIHSLYCTCTVLHIHSLYCTCTVLYIHLLYCTYIHFIVHVLYCTYIYCTVHACTVPVHIIIRCYM